MKDQQARELLSLLLEYVDTYPTDTDKLTVSELADDLAMSITNGREDAATVAAMIKSNRQWQW